MKGEISFWALMFVAERGLALGSAREIALIWPRAASRSGRLPAVSVLAHAAAYIAPFGCPAALTIKPQSASRRTWNLDNGGRSPSFVRRPIA